MAHTATFLPKLYTGIYQLQTKKNINNIETVNYICYYL